MSQEIEGVVEEERAGGELVPVVQNSALQAMERASTDTQVATAKKYPRRTSEFRSSLMTFAKTSPQLASACVYAKPVGGEIKRGPSARFAEMVAAAWGNLRIGSRIIEVGNERIIVQGVCHDLQTNNLVSVEVPQGILKRNGQRYSEDVIDTNLKANMSKARRDAILQVVPRALWLEAFDEVMKVAKGSIKSLEQDREAALEFAKRKYGLEPHRLLAAIGVGSVADLDVDRLLSVKAFFEAINSGDATVAECFPEVSRIDTVRSKLDAAKQPAEEVKPSEDSPAKEPKKR